MLRPISRATAAGAALLSIAVLPAGASAATAEASGLVGPLLGTVGNVVSPEVGDALEEAGTSLDTVIDPVTGAVDPILAPVLEPGKPVLDTLLGAEALGSLTAVAGGAPVNADALAQLDTTLTQLLAVSGLPTNEADLATLAAVISKLQELARTAGLPDEALALLVKVTAGLNQLVGGVDLDADLLGIDRQVADLVRSVNLLLAARGLPPIVLAPQGSTPNGGPGTFARRDERAGRLHVVSRRASLKGRRLVVKVKCKAATSGCRGTVGGRRVRLGPGRKKAIGIGFTRPNARKAAKARRARLLVVSDGVDVRIVSIKVARKKKR